MTDEQEATIRDIREQSTFNEMDEGGHRQLVFISQDEAAGLIKLIDAQEAELQVARDTIARYEAMMAEVVDVIDFADGSGLCYTGTWTWFEPDPTSYYGHTFNPPCETALDAYDALKEATK